MDPIRDYRVHIAARAGIFYFTYPTNLFRTFQQASQFGKVSLSHLSPSVTNLSVDDLTSIKLLKQEQYMEMGYFGV